MSFYLDEKSKPNGLILGYSSEFQPCQCKEIVENMKYENPLFSTN